MNPYLDDMRTALCLLEEAMRRAGWWQKTPPSAEKLASTEPFCIDTLTFSEWLQWVYTPKIHAMMNQSGQLPSVSGLTPIAEEAWRNTPHAPQLLAIVSVLDAIADGSHQQKLQALVSMQ